MKKRFSSQELFEIRNAIPVDMLIKDQLQTPSNVSQGIFRFSCPFCNAFNATVNPSTNLARCFSCCKNFNTIDLVMKVKNIGFKESVLFLKTVLAKNRAQVQPDVLQDRTTTYSKPVHAKSKADTKPLCDRRRGLITVRQIFQSMFLDQEGKS